MAPYTNKSNTDNSFSISGPSVLDIQIAGWGLVIPAIAFLILYILCIKAMWQLKSQFPMFGFLISFGVCNVAQILFYGYLGVSILFQYTIIDELTVPVIGQLLLHPFIYHYIILAASRFCGLAWPHFTQIHITPKRVAVMCGLVWMVGIAHFGIVLL